MKRTAITFAIGFALLSAVPVFAQPVTMKEEKPGQLKLAKITPAAATATAQAKVPNGKIESAEIEKEDGKLLYAFTMKIAGKSGVEEVLVDATTGKVLKQEHETPEDEAKEAKADVAKAAKAKTDSLTAGKRKAVKPPTIF